VHELAIAQGVIDTVTQRLPGATITGVCLEIGALSGVVADSLLFCFDLATAISVIEGDQETALDASRIRAAGCQVVQINTGTGCHLDAAMVACSCRPPLEPGCRPGTTGCAPARRSHVSSVCTACEPAEGAGQKPRISARVPLPWRH